MGAGGGVDGSPLAGAPPARWGGGKAGKGSSTTPKQRKGPRDGGGKGGKGQSPITPRSSSYSQWYLDVIKAAELIERGPVAGTMVLRPDGMALWEQVQAQLGAAISKTGARNAYFPLLIPQSFLSKEATHVAGFAQECAVVTHHRLRAVPGGDGELEVDPAAELAEPLVVRPTSEAMIWHMMKGWIAEMSAAELPLKLNQWSNVVRWELRTRPFLRSSEFLWQEGHTAHGSAACARRTARQMLGVYGDFAEGVLAVPVVRGAKSPRERFAGAEDTLTIEAMMQNGWALQSGTSHFLGQNFAKAFDATFQDGETGARVPVWATSWGVSTRVLGAVVMTHSDDRGLVLPPRLAPTQCVIVPMGGKAGALDAEVVAAARAIAEALEAAGVRARVDERAALRPGAKFFDHERRGVPLRLDIGRRELDAAAVKLVPRLEGRAPIEGVPMAGVAAAVVAELAAVQEAMLAAAQRRMAVRTVRVHSYEEMVAALGAARPAAAAVAAGEGDGGDEHGYIGAEEGAAAMGADGADGAAEPPSFFLAPWADDLTGEREEEVQRHCKATLRCYPDDEQESLAEGQLCFHSGQPATHIALFARAY